MKGHPIDTGPMRKNIYGAALALIAIMCGIIKGIIAVKEGKVFYGQEPPSGESTTTESGVNYQLLAVMY